MCVTAFGENTTCAKGFTLDENDAVMQTVDSFRNKGFAVTSKRWWHCHEKSVCLHGGNAKKYNSLK
jgi:hypothetical protein